MNLEQVLKQLATAPTVNSETAPEDVSKERSRSRKKKDVPAPTTKTVPPPPATTVPAWKKIDTIGGKKMGK
jgi:hypothetical protein